MSDLTLTDEELRALVYARFMGDEDAGFIGYGIAHLRGPDGRTKQLAPFHNLITDAGDAYAAAKIVVGIGPAAPTAPTAANGMKLGTSSTAATKSGAASFIGTFITGSNLAFDTGFATTANLGAGLGVNAVYKTTWAAGVATNATINEVTVVNDQATATGGAAASTYSRAVITTVAKGAADSLAITYNWKYLGT